MMSDVMEIKAKADRLVELTSQQSVIKAEIDEIKAWFEKLATDDLRDTKKKTIDYWGSNNSKVVVGNSETVKPVSMTMVKKLLGDVFGDFVKEDTTYKMTDPCKRLFTMMFMGNYTEGSLDETIKAKAISTFHSAWQQCSCQRWFTTRRKASPFNFCGKWGGITNDAGNNNGVFVLRERWL